MILGTLTRTKAVTGIAVGTASFASGLALFSNTTWAPAPSSNDTQSSVTTALQDKFLVPFSISDMEDENK
ncbi:hypothetical protein AT251_22065 [Enterovibrio nigricans]|nr:hypothetical protein [Enterovibrio nigricans]PKF49002.1 hypothetical protein AT251_22065 [Enterovibrio nigricans]